jgi:glycosyltransferase involved in cell wall biosynthesis
MLGAGSLEASVRRLARELPVEFPGWKDPKPYLVAADVVLCTSKHESYGASIVEALAAGVPVVAPDVGIAKEAGAIIASPAELAEKVAEVLAAGATGVLRIPLLTAELWVTEWRKTLI